MYALYWCISDFIEATISWYWFLKIFSKINNNNKYNVIILILKENLIVQ